MVKKTTLFKHINNRTSTQNQSQSKKIVQDNLKLTIKKNKMIFTKLLNTNGYQLSNKNGDYYFDFDGDPKNLKHIKLVIFDIVNKKLTFNTYKIISIYSYNKQYNEDVEIESDDIQSTLLTTQIRVTNILDVNDSITISSARYRFLFTNDDKNILYSFANHKSKFPLIIEQLIELFGVVSIHFSINEKNPNSSSHTPISSGGWYKKQMKKYN